MCSCGTTLIVRGHIIAEVEEEMCAVVRVQGADAVFPVICAIFSTKNPEKLGGLISIYSHIVHSAKPRLPLRD